MKLVNVRLNADDARLVAELKKRGVELSGLVREAIREAYAAERRGRTGRRVADIMAEIYAELPDPAGLPPARYDLRDRRSVRRAIARRLRRSR